jgi:antitoxin (DNA-binding transcriptional repressor) of toxin-antitoxin stability system
VEQGQEVVIARSGVPIARLVAWQAPSQPVAAPGAMRGQITLAEDFNAPLDGLFEALL